MTKGEVAKARKKPSHEKSGTKAAFPVNLRVTYVTGQTVPPTAVRKQDNVSDERGRNVTVCTRFNSVFPRTFFPRKLVMTGKYVMQACVTIKSVTLVFPASIMLEKPVVDGSFVQATPLLLSTFQSLSKLVVVTPLLAVVIFLRYAITRTRTLLSDAGFMIRLAAIK